MRFEVGGTVAWKVALCAPVRFLPDVNEGVSFKTGILTKWLVTLLAIEQFLRRVNKRVPVQVGITDKWLVTLLAIILLNSLVNLIVMAKGTFMDENAIGRPLRDPGKSRDPGIFSKSRSRGFQKSNPGIFRDFQKPLNDCIPRLSTTLIDHNCFFWDL